MTENSSKKKRIFQIAKDLNISHTEIMEFLERTGEKVASHMSPVEPEVYDRILGEFAKERVIVERSRKEKARIDIQRARVRETKTTRFDKILSPAEQRLLEAEEKLKLQESREEAIRQKKIEEEKSAAEAVEAAKVEAEAAKAAKESEKARAETPSAAGNAKAGKPAPASRDEKKPDKHAGPRRDSKSITGQPLKPAAKAGDKESTQPKAKLKRIDMREIASKVNQGKKRHGKFKKVDPTKVKSAKKAMKQTLASMSGKDRKRRPTRGRDQHREEIVETEETTRQNIKVHEFISVSKLAAAMNISAMDVISTCMGMGIMVTINQRLDMETLSLITDELGFDIDSDNVLDDEKILEQISEESPGENLEKRPPIVTVMGHVDHGKTSLLDYIRSENVVGGESGGITQHIGAHEVELPGGEKITFLDTPGHAAFTAMRARGAQVTDIVVLIVSADDAVMPQTIEAINHSKAAGVSIIVAINKVDKPDADTERVKRELSEQNVLVEDWGGKYQCAEISAKTGQGVEELLEKILLESEMLDLKASKTARANGAVIESKLDRGLGPVATVLVQKGTIKIGDTFLCGSQIGRIRAMQNERGSNVKTAGPSDPVQIQGFDGVAQAGDRFIIFQDEREAKRISSERIRVKREVAQRQKSVSTLDEISRQIREGKVKHLSILVKADVDGSLEAIADTFYNLGTDEVAVNIIHRGVGMVSETDVLLAQASGAVIISFRVTTAVGAKLLAKNEKIEIRNYDVIYDAVNEIRLTLEGLLEPEKVETPLGVAEVRAVFKVPKFGFIAGCYMKEGKAVRAAYLRVIRDGEMIHEGTLTTLRRFKDDVKDVQEGFECGIGVENFKAFEEGDLIEVYEIKEVKRTLA